jgi:hypothetical protein
VPVVAVLERVTADLVALVVPVVVAREETTALTVQRVLPQIAVAAVVEVVVAQLLLAALVRQVWSLSAGQPRKQSTEKGNLQCHFTMLTLLA